MQIPINFESGIGKEATEAKNVDTHEDSEAVVENAKEKKSSPEDMAYIRLKADYDNLNKRLQKEMTQRVDYELGSFFRDFLSIYDDLDRALPYCANTPSDDGNRNLFEGICLIHKRIGDLLKKNGVERMEPIGKPFDPLYHEAVMMESRPGVKSNTIVAEIEPGYLFRGNLLRPAKVKVTQ
jgi:molecular chaperone GrpE